MAETAETVPPQDQILSALLLAVVGALFYASLGALLTFLFFFLGWIPGAIFGIVHGFRMARNTPLREAMVLFVGCAATAGILGWYGNPLFGILGPVAGVLLRVGVQRLGPERCRQVSQILGVSLVLVSISLGGWFLLHRVK